MAYRYSATSDESRFAIGPLGGITLGAQTLAMFLKKNVGASGTREYGPVVITNPGVSVINWHDRFTGGTQPLIASTTGSGTIGTSPISSTSIWYLLAWTWSGSGAARLHYHDGTSWTHTNATSGTMTSQALSGTDRIYVPVPASFGGIGIAADIVCIGIKRADSADLTVETLSRTSFAAWTSYGFDWLIGFDTSLETAGKLQDQSALGTGDEVTRAGVTTGVADPPGWSFSAAVAPVADFTGTPVTGTASLSVTFTDTSTNTPTSWAWTFGDGGTSTSQNPSHSYTTPGVYTVTLTATNAAGSNVKTRTGYITVTESIVYAAGGGIEVW